VIGSPASPATLAAAVIRVAPGVTVHGTLWARVRGVVCEPAPAAREAA
jgi:hypothetical protein